MAHNSNPDGKDPLVSLATRAVDAYVRCGHKVSVPSPVPDVLSRRAGVFVSIKKKGQLRGCVGTFFPAEPSIAHEIVANAIRAATSDPRFPAIVEDELPELTFSVDVLSEPESCEISELDPSRYGVIVSRGWKRGLLLPDLEGVDCVADQVAIAKSKAGIHPGESVEIARFTVERHH